MSQSDAPIGDPERAAPKKRWAWYLGLGCLASVLAGAVAAPLLLGLYGSDPVQKAVRDYNFQPMDPPSTAYGPGSIYLVDMFGKIKAQVCNADSVQTKPNLHKAEDAVIKSLIKASASTDASLAEKLKAQGKGESVSEVHLVLEHVQIANFDLATVSRINAELQSDEQCSEQVAKHISQGRCLAQSHSVLVASSGFKYASKTNSAVAAKVKEEVEQLAISTATDLGLSESIMRFGKGLYYGFQLADRCMMLPDAKAARYVPSEEWWYVAAVQNLWSWGLESTQLAWLSIQQTYARVIATTHSTV